VNSDGHVPSGLIASDSDYAEPEDQPAPVRASHRRGGDESTDPDADLLPDESPIQLRRELRRRAGNPPLPPPPAADGGTMPGARPPGSGGRHARRDAQPRPPRLDYVPRHAIRTPGPGSVSPTDVTEVFSRVRQDPTERPRPARPHSDPIPLTQRLEPLAAPPPPLPEPESASDNGAPGKRVRVVLSQRKGQARPVRTVVDVQELTQVGEVLSSSLIRSQLALALRIGGIALIALGALPAMFVIFPVLGRFELFGLRLPWLLLGVLAYPFLLALGWMYSRSADRLEQVFADHIQN
jgi:hypothetical protein